MQCFVLLLRAITNFDHGHAEHLLVTNILPSRSGSENLRLLIWSPYPFSPSINGITIVLQYLPTRLTSSVIPRYLVKSLNSSNFLQIQIYARNLSKSLSTHTLYQLKALRDDNAKVPIK